MEDVERNSKKAKLSIDKYKQKFEQRKH